MEKPAPDRRQVSYTGLLDSAIRAAGRLAMHPDPQTKSLANQILSDLKQMRRQMPARRKFDTEAPRKQA